MYLYTKLEEQKNDISIAFIGCGKFISMFLSQYNHLNKIKIDTIVDLKIDNAKNNCLKSGLTQDTVEKINFVESLDEVIDRDIDIFIEATGNPIAGTIHAAKIIRKKKHVILVNVEADVTCGKYLSDLAKKHNVLLNILHQTLFGVTMD
jgi:predicted homoserine dehydrogenase-like protein